MKFVTNARRGVAGRETSEKQSLFCVRRGSRGEGEGGGEPCPGSRSVEWQVRPFLGSPGERERERERERTTGPLIRYFIGHNPPLAGGRRRSFVPGMKVVYAWMEGEEEERERRGVIEGRIPLADRVLLPAGKLEEKGRRTAFR